MAHMTVAQKEAGRLAAAKINGGASAALPRGNGRYTVTSRDGETCYTCQVVTLDYVRCDCKAGQYRENACWHAACAWLAAVASSALKVAA